MHILNIPSNDVVMSLCKWVFQLLNIPLICSEHLLCPCPQKHTLKHFFYIHLSTTKTNQLLNLLLEWQLLLWLIGNMNLWVLGDLPNSSQAFYNTLAFKTNKSKYNLWRMDEWMGGAASWHSFSHPHESQNFPFHHYV